MKKFFETDIFQILSITVALTVVHLTHGLPTLETRHHGRPNDTEVMGDYQINLRIANKCPDLSSGLMDNLFLNDAADPLCPPIRGESCDYLDCALGKQCCFDACELKFICLDEPEMVNAKMCVVHHEGRVTEYPAGSIFGVVDASRHCQTCVCATDGSQPLCGDPHPCSDQELTPNL